MRDQHRVTELVPPLDDDAPNEAPDEGAPESFDELDWCFDDPVLTAQLKAVKQGRGIVLSALLASLVLMGVAVCVVL